jgi:2-oxoglutarate ferredoxin oxidoreductase subunit alpha
MIELQSSELALQPARAVDDIVIAVAGQGGDGTQTIIALLTHALFHRGLHLYNVSNIASRIKGGHAGTMLRGSTRWRGCLNDRFDVLMAFDTEAIEKSARWVADDGVIIYDESRARLPASTLPPNVSVISIPFSRVAVRELRRDLFKNCVGFGVLSRVIGLPDEEAIGCIRQQFKRLSAQDLDYNLRAFRQGLEFADDLGLTADRCIYRLPSQPHANRLLINGNEATAFGFAAAGGRFFAGYPITPATEILDWLTRRLPRLGGIAVQAEDEMAAINMAIGAAMTGARAMTGSSGPGIALMQESVGHCGSAEIPLVIVDCQRAGPSTGMPTKIEQSDIGMLVHGSNGDFPRVVLCPGNPEECFQYGALATNLAAIAQMPIYIAQDGLSQTAETTAMFDLDSVKIEPGARLSAAEVAQLKEYRRYAITDDGISPWAVPGTPGAMNLVTGNERNEWGQVVTDAPTRTAMMDKRRRKVETIRPLLPAAAEWGDDDAVMGVICMGMISGVLDEVRERLERIGVYIRCHRPRTLFPVLDDTLEFIRRYSTVFVVEHNESGQLLNLLRGAGAPAEHLHSIRKYDGTPYLPFQLYQEFVAAIDQETAQ